MKISIAEAQSIIAQHDLHPPQRLWHYSFNIEKFYDHMFLVSDGKYIRLQAPRQLHQWAPLPIFTNKHLDSIGASSSPFWICRLSTFDEFLLRRSLQSSKPRKHFPTLQTFEKKDLALNGRLVISNLETNSFIEIYDSLRRSTHLSGSETLSVFFRSNIGVPKEWFKMMTLTTSDSITGIGLLVDDGVSQSLINLASIIDKNRYGLYMLSLWTKECCQMGRKFIDAGISGTYGIYKNQIFLDSIVWQF